MLHLHEVSLPGNGYGDVTDVPIAFDLYKSETKTWEEGARKAYGGDFAKALATHASQTGVIYTHRNADNYTLSMLGSYAREYSNLRVNPAHPLAGLPPKRIEPGGWKRRVKRVRGRQDVLLGRSTNSTMSPTYSTSDDAPFYYRGALTLYPNGTAQISSDALPTGYADHPTDMEPVVLTYDTLVNGNASAEYKSHLEQNGAAILASKQHDSQAAPSKAVQKAPATTTLSFPWLKKLEAPSQAVSLPWRSWRTWQAGRVASGIAMLA